MNTKIFLQNRLSLPLLLALLVWNPLFGQRGESAKTDQSGVLLFNLSYGGQVPGGDLADRFGINGYLGAGLDYLLANNWAFGFEGHILFGSEVKNDVLSILRNPEGGIYADNGTLAEVTLRERGFYLGAHLGKLIPVSAANRRSGIRINLGAGLLQHKVRVQEDPQAFVPQIAGDNKKGYDRLTNGLALNQFIGYQYLSKNRRINFFVGFDLTQAFTQNRRSWNFDTLGVDTAKRLDLLFGFRAGWSLPFYLGEDPEEIFY